MPSSDPAQRFQDILDEIVRIADFTSGMDVGRFAADEKAVYAVKYSLSIISEAAAKLADTGPSLCPNIPWREIRGLGNRLRHEYDAIDVVRIWFLIERDLPKLETACKRALTILGPTRPP